MNKKIISIILSLIMTICTVIIPVSAYADNYYISGVDISEHNDKWDAVTCMRSLSSPDEIRSVPDSSSSPR